MLASQEGSLYVCMYVCMYVVLVFYGPSTLFRSFWARSVNLSTLFLGKPPRQLTSTVPVNDTACEELKIYPAIFFTLPKNKNKILNFTAYLINVYVPLVLWIGARNLDSKSENVHLKANCNLTKCGNE